MGIDDAVMALVVLQTGNGRDDRDAMDGRSGRSPEGLGISAPLRASTMRSSSTPTAFGEQFLLEVADGNQLGRLTQQRCKYPPLNVARLAAAIVWPPCGRSR